MIVLRAYQSKIESEIFEGWKSGHRNVLAVAPTGAGKTSIKSSIFKRTQLPGCAIAHRQELVGQISGALAENGVYHRIIAPEPVVKFVIQQHIKKFGTNFHHNQSPMAVAGIDTLLARAENYVQWCNQVQIVDIDEAHHVLKDNKWGKGFALFPHSWGVGFTATPIRADKKSLGRERGGLFDHLVIGPTMRELIRAGHLADYRIFGPPKSIDTTDVAVSDSTGDFNKNQLRTAAHKSTITGDMVKHYLRIAGGLLAICFVVDVEIAVETAKAFRAAGVPAEAISAKTPDHVRIALFEKFQRGEIRVLVNVDLFGEGMDVPGIQCVIMGRPTQSYGLYIQQFGRVLRPAPGKTHGIIIDHVENVKRHGLPDQIRKWSLHDEDRGTRAKKVAGVIPVTNCIVCFETFEAITKTCPFCGHVNEPLSRSAPHFVDGDLVEYDDALLRKLRGEIDKVDGPARVNPYGDPMANHMIKRAWVERQEAQRVLREAMSFWGGIQHQVYDRPDSEIQRRFYHLFGIDVMTAQTLGRPDAEKLTALIREQLT